MCESHAPITDLTLQVLLSVTGLRCPMRLTCTFGLVSVPARCITHNLIECITPEHPLGQISVEVVAPDVGGSSSGKVFAYIRDPIVHRALPSRALQTAHTPVVVRGAGFLNVSSLACRFGLSTFHDVDTAKPVRAS